MTNDAARPWIRTIFTALLFLALGFGPAYATFCYTGADCPDDGIACTANQCQNNECVYVAQNFKCADDGLWCDGDEICSPTQGCVHTGSPCIPGYVCDDSVDQCFQCNSNLMCDDHNSCTDNVCSSTSGGWCQYPAKNCSDNNACTSDSCDPSTTNGCVHSPVSCDDGNICTTDTCNTATGCSHTPVSCDDGNACTVDSCDSVTGCSHIPLSCDDNNACTTDTCSPTTGCVHTPVNCDDGLYCNGTETCDPTQGCEAGTNACPAQLCDESTDSCFDCAPGDHATHNGVWFDGSNDYVRVGSPQALELHDAFTIEGWILPTNNTYGIIVSKENEYELARFPDGTIRWAVNNSYPGWIWISTGAVAPLKTWTHVAFVFDYQTSQMISTYVNGTLVHSMYETGPIRDTLPPDDEFRIGNRLIGGNPFAGSIDEVMVWSQARTQAQIQQSMGAVLTGAEPGLVGYWRFEEGSGSTTADIASGNDGTLNGAAWVVSGCDDGNWCNGAESCSLDLHCTAPSAPECPGQICDEQDERCLACVPSGPKTASGVRLDGVDDFIQVGSVQGLSASTALTLEAWILPTGPGFNGNAIIIAKEGEYLLSRYNDGNIWYALNNSSPGFLWQPTPVHTPLNSWSHVALVYDGSGVSIYLNGSLSYTGTATGPLTAAAAPNDEFRIGSRECCTPYFNGEIKDVNVWNVAQSASEIQSTMDGKLTGNEAGLIGDWPLAEGAGNVTEDRAAGHTGTLTNGAQWIDWSCDDGVGCTTDLCSANDTCTHSPDDASCEDGLVCTTDTCSVTAGCLHESRVCPDDGIYCNGIPSCNEADGCHNMNIACEGADICDESTRSCVSPAAAFNATLTQTGMVSRGICEQDDGALCPGAKACISQYDDQCKTEVDSCFDEYITAENFADSLKECIIEKIGFESFETLLEAYGKEVWHFVPIADMVLCAGHLGGPVASYVGCLTEWNRTVNEHLLECNCENCAGAPDCEQRFGIDIHTDNLCRNEGVFVDTTCLDHGQDVIPGLVFTGLHPEDTLEARCSRNANWRVTTHDLFDLETGKPIPGRMCKPALRQGRSPRLAGETVTAYFDCRGSEPCISKEDISLLLDVSGISTTESVNVRVQYATPQGKSGGAVFTITGPQSDFKTDLYATVESGYSVEVLDPPPGRTCTFLPGTSDSKIPGQWPRSSFNMGGIDCGEDGGAGYLIGVPVVNQTSSDPGLLRVILDAPTGTVTGNISSAAPTIFGPVKDHTPYHLRMQTGSTDSGCHAAPYNHNMQCCFGGGATHASGLLDGHDVAHPIYCSCVDHSGKCDADATDRVPPSTFRNHGGHGEGIDTSLFDQLSGYPDGPCREYSFVCTPTSDQRGPTGPQHIPCLPDSVACCCGNPTQCPNTSCAGCYCLAEGYDATDPYRCRWQCTDGIPKSENPHAFITPSLSTDTGLDSFPVSDKELWVGAHIEDYAGVSAYGVAVDWDVITGQSITGAPLVWDAPPYHIDTSALAPGRHVLHLLVADSDTSSDSGPAFEQLDFFVDHDASLAAKCAGDLMVPAISLESPSLDAELTAGPVDLRARVHDDVWVYRTSFVIDDQPEIVATPSGDTYRYTWSASQGSHTIKARAVDVCGKGLDTQPIQVNVGPPATCETDSIGPVLSFTSPLNTTLSDAQTVDFELDAQDSSGVQRVDWVVDSGAPISNAFGPFRFEYPFTAAGVHTVVATAYDMCGNPSSEQIQIQIGDTAALCDIDHDPPTVQVVLPPDGASLPRGAISLTAQAQDPSGVTSVSFEIDGSVPPDATLTEAPYVYSFVASRQTENVRVKAVDLCGNAEWSQPVTYSIQNTKPDGNPDYVTVQKDGSILINPLVNDTDPDGDAIRLVFNPIIELPAHGTAERIDDLTIRYTPNPGFPASGTASDVFRYRIVDSYGAVHSARVFVTIVQSP